MHGQRGLLGGLEIGHNVLDMTPSSSISSGDLLVSGRGSSFQRGACLGPKIKLPSGDDTTSVEDKNWPRVMRRWPPIS